MKAKTKIIALLPLTLALAGCAKKPAFAEGMVPAQSPILSVKDITLTGDGYICQQFKNERGYPLAFRKCTVYVERGGKIGEIRTETDADGWIFIANIPDNDGIYIDFPEVEKKTPAPADGQANAPVLPQSKEDSDPLPLSDALPATELKNMMPNSWEKLTRLSEKDEEKFFSYRTVNIEIRKELEKNFYRIPLECMDIRVYRETVSGRVFYRLLLCNERLETLLSCTYKDEKLSFAGEYSEWRSKKIVQIVFARKNDGSLKELAVLPYREHQSTQGSAEGFDFWDLMFKTLGNGEIGFFVTEVSVGYESKYIENDEKFSLTVRKQKGQIAASNRTSFAKYDDDVTYALKDAVSIQASDCLFDPKCPLKYSIQNAFDGNPATSYVENTKDDLMLLDLGTGGKEISRLVERPAIN